MSHRGGRRKKSRSKRRKQALAERARRQANAGLAPSADNREEVPVSTRDASSSSTVVSLDPLGPIIVRSARPMEGRSDADPARFPPPSTTAGCLRTAWARATGRPFGPDLADLKVAGPLLLRHDDQVLAPKPMDAVYFNRGDERCCLRAEPRPFDAGVGADLPLGLLPVQLTESLAGKPASGPTWWRWNDILAFRRGESVSYHSVCENGWEPPPGDRRTHVAINSELGAADPGRLFQTEGLDLDATDWSEDSSGNGLRLLMRCDEPLGDTLVHLGGKRRLAALQPESERVWPSPPADWLQEMGCAQGLCLTLLTPGIFSAGFLPGWLDEDTLIGSPHAAPDLRLQLCAVAVGRWQPHSGWDLAKRQPRATRKLADAGATYWFRVLDDASPDQRGALWLTSISDLDQDRRDGFGLVLPSAWTPPSGRTSRNHFR